MSTTNWIGGTGITGSWFTLGNWDNGVPGAGDDAIISDFGVAQIDAAATVHTLTLTSPNGGVVELEAGGSLSASGGIFVGTGTGGPGFLDLSGSASLTGDITLKNGFLDVELNATLSNAISFDSSYPGSINVYNNATLTLTGPLSGGNLLLGPSVSTDGTIIITGSNTTTGQMGIGSATTVQIGAGGTRQPGIGAGCEWRHAGF